MMEYNGPIEKPRFEDVATDAFSSQERLWKPATLAVNQSYLRNQIMPFFRGRSICDITRVDVQRWFASLHRTPAAANRALPVLSVILRRAVFLGHRTDGDNPCAGIRRFRVSARNRFLTAEEMRRLDAALAEHDDDAPQPRAAVRLLLLTGCRQGEVRSLRWDDYREGNLFLRDSKTGPRTVWLCSAARQVLDALPRPSRWIFPAAREDGPMRTETLYRHWRAFRETAHLPDVRLHDLRHSYASFALRHGETVLTIGRLLGHRDPASTLRYLHFDDALASRAVQTVADAMAVSP